VGWRRNSHLIRKPSFLGISSEPTVWDGDSPWRRVFRNSVITLSGIVPSPPCGMATISTFRFLLVGNLFHWAMGFRAHRVGWRLNLTCPFKPYHPPSVPSPPCGMETRAQALIARDKNCSKPTVWDGDIPLYRKEDTFFLVPSPPCGMATH
jgi:hypothetical protein